MPALPFFSVLPTQPANTTPAGPLAPAPTSESPSNLGGQLQNTMSNGVDLTHDGSSDQSAQSLSFWQTFQQTTQLSELSDGQDFAGLSPLAALPEELEVDDELVMPILTPTIQMPDDATAKQLDTQVESQPILAASIQTLQSAEGAETEFENTPFAQIEMQRAAHPAYQAIESETPKGPVKAQPVLVDSAIDASKATAPMTSMKTLNESSSGEKSLLTHPIMEDLSQSSEIDGPNLESGFKLKDLGLEEKPLTIHEKPITLQQSDSQVKHQVSTIAEFAQAEGADVDGLQAQAPQQTREQTAQAKLAAENQLNLAKSSTQFKVDVPPQNPQWSEQIAQRITIMSNEQIQSARIQLDPPELGLLEIKIRVQQDQVNVAFASNHQTVRDALETQSPRLKELMEQQGVELGDVNVSDHGQQQMANGDQQEGGEFSGNNENGDWIDADVDGNQQSVTVQTSDSLVDDFV